MEENAEFLEQLGEAVDQQKNNIELTQLPKLKELLGIFQTYYENLFNILIRKSLISEDPYKYDEKISEVTVPSSETYLESERQEQLSQRLSSYHTQLEFLNNYYQFSLDFLNLKRIKRIIDLIKYINWTNISATSSHVMTRAIGELLTKVKGGSDHMSSQIITDSITQIEKNIKSIMGILDSIVAFLREEYKYQVRRSLLPNVKLNEKADPKENIKILKKSFPQYFKDESFYPDLMQELMDEEYSENGEILKKDLLKRLFVKESKPKQSEAKQTFKSILLQGTRILASSGFQIEDAISKLTENNLIYTSRKMSFGERLNKWIRKIVGGKEDNQTYEIEFFDVVTSSTRTEKINFVSFMDELQKKAKLFAALSNKASSTYCRLESSTDAKLYDFLNKNINMLQLIHRRMSGLNDFFKVETPKEKRGRIRAINLEINAVKNSIIKSNKKKHEYVAMKEEQEQMKRLGIKVEE